MNQPHEHQWEAIDIVSRSELDPGTKTIRCEEDPSGIFQVFACCCDEKEAQEVPDRVFN